MQTWTYPSPYLPRLPKGEQNQEPLGQGVRGYLAVPRRGQPFSILSAEPELGGPPSWPSRDLEPVRRSPAILNGLFWGAEEVSL